MKVLITGGSGFVGSNLIKKLISIYNDIFIISLDNYSTGSINNHIINKNIHYIKGNTWDIFNIKEILEFNPIYVFHFGEYSRIHKSFEETTKTFQSNFFGTQQILDYVILKNSKLIYSGSSAIFGENSENLSPYAFTKSKNIELIKNYKTWYNLNFSICYFYNVYGPGQIKNGDYATVIGIFEEQFKNNIPLTVVKPGTQTRIFTHIDDIIEGILIVATKGNGDGYVLAAKESFSILDIVKLFDTNFVYIDNRKGERYNSIIPFDKMETEFCWTAKIKLKNYIKKLMEDLLVYYLN